jgi:hypothetical protein
MKLYNFLCYKDVGTSTIGLFFNRKEGGAAVDSFLFSIAFGEGSLISR